MEPTSKIPIDPQSFTPLSNKLGDVKDALIDSKTVLESIKGSVDRIEKGGVLDFISKTTPKATNAKQKDPVKENVLRKLINFLDQQTDKTKEQKVNNTADKVSQPTAFRNIVQSTHKLIESFTSKSTEELKNTKNTETSETKETSLTKALKTHLKQVSDLFLRLKQDKTGSTVQPSVPVEKITTTKQSDLPNSSILKQFTSFLDSLKTLKSNGSKSTDLKDSDTNIQKIVKAFNILKPTKKEDTKNTKNQNTTNLLSKVTSLFDVLKQSKLQIPVNTDTKTDNNTLQNVIKYFKILTSTKSNVPINIETPSPNTAATTQVQSLHTTKNTTPADTTNTVLENKKTEPQPLQTKKEPTQTPVLQDSFFKKISSYFEGLKENKKTSQISESRKDEAAQTNKTSTPTTKNESTTNIINNNDGLISKLTAIFESFNKEKIGSKNVDLKDSDSNFQKVIKSINFLRGSISKKQELSVPNSEDSVLKKLGNFLTNFKKDKDAGKPTDVKVSASAAQKETNQPTAQQLPKESVQHPSSDTLLAKLVSAFHNLNKDKETKKNVDLKDDDSSFKKIVKSLNFLKVAKKESPDSSKSQSIVEKLQTFKQSISSFFKTSHEKETTKESKTDTTTTPLLKQDNKTDSTTNANSLRATNLLQSSSPALPVSKGAAAPVQSTAASTQAEIFEQEDTNEKILKVLERIEKTTKNIFKTISGKRESSEPVEKKKEEKQKKPSQPEQPSSDPSLPIGGEGGMLRGAWNAIKSAGSGVARGARAAAAGAEAAGAGLVTLAGTSVAAASTAAIAGTVAVGAAAGYGIGKLIEPSMSRAIENAGTKSMNSEKAFKSGKALVDLDVEALKDKRRTKGRVAYDVQKYLSKDMPNMKPSEKEVVKFKEYAKKKLGKDIFEYPPDVPPKKTNADTTATPTAETKKIESEIKTESSDKTSTSPKEKDEVSKNSDSSVPIKDTTTSTIDSTKETTVSPVSTPKAKESNNTSTTESVTQNTTNIVTKAESVTPAVSGQIRKQKEIQRRNELIIEFAKRDVKDIKDLSQDEVESLTKELGPTELTPKQNAQIGRSFLVGLIHKSSSLKRSNKLPQLEPKIDTTKEEIVAPTPQTVSNEQSKIEKNTTTNPSIVSKAAEATTVASVSTTPTNTTTASKTTDTGSPNVVSKAKNIQPKLYPAHPQEITYNNLTAPLSTENTSANPIPQTASQNTKTITPTDTPEPKKGLWERAKEIGTKALLYSMPVAGTYMASKAVYDKLVTPTTTNTSAAPANSIPTQTIAQSTDMTQALKQIAIGLNTSKNNDKDLATSILKMSEALVAAGLMKAPPIELTNVIQGNNQSQKIDLETAFSNNKDPIRAVRNEFYNY